MDLHGHVPSAFERRPVQAPGLIRDGPFRGPGPAVHHPLEPLPRPELLENKIAAQAAEMERLARENHRLAASNTNLREELLATQQGLQRVQVHIGSFQTESDIQVKGLLEKIGKLEADIRAGEMVKKEFHQAHLELQSVTAARQELVIKIQRTTEELQKASTEIKKLPQMHAELDGLRQEHQKLRAAFEYEKGANMEQIEQMRTMDKNLISMAREVEKLRAEVLNAEKRAHGPNSYGVVYGSPHPVNPSAGQGSGYPEHGYRQGGGHVDTVYNHGGGYPNVGIGHGGPSSYSEAYGRTQAPTTGGAAGELYDAYGGVNGAGNSDGYGSMQIPMTGWTVARMGTDSSGHVTMVGYDAARGGATSTQR
ncbi:protein FLX-like 3 [Cocos nucifera]|nr:protein FLX-like 3 [Cocos nucifera]